MFCIISLLNYLFSIIYLLIINVLKYVVLYLTKWQNNANKILLGLRMKDINIYYTNKA